MKRNKEKVKDRTRRRRKLKKQRYLSQKRKACEVKDSGTDGRIHEQDNSESCFSIDSRYLHVGPPSDGLMSVKRTNENSKTGKRKKSVSSTMPLEKFNELMDDPLFTEMLKYQQSKRLTVFLHERVQHANPTV